MFRLASLAAAVLIASPAVGQTSEPAGRITLTFDAGAQTGQILVALYDAQAAYDGGGAPAQQRVLNVASGETVAVFEGVPAGDYAARAFHDVNGDGEMNTNPFGMPTEPYAFSNNAVGNMGPAKWDRAHFTVAGETAQTLRIK